MSSEKKTLRIPSDTYESLCEMSEDRGLNEHKTGIRALQRGLQAYGYGDFATDDGSDGDWLATLFVEIAKSLAMMGVAFLIVSRVAPPVVLWFAAASLGGASFCLLGERHSGAIGEWLGVPDVPPWVDPEVENT